MVRRQGLLQVRGSGGLWGHDIEQRPVGSEQIWGRDALAERNRSTGSWGREWIEGGPQEETVEA